MAKHGKQWHSHSIGPRQAVHILGNISNTLRVIGSVWVLPREHCRQSPATCHGPFEAPRSCQRCAAVVRSLRKSQRWAMDRGSFREWLVVSCGCALGREKPWGIPGVALRVVRTPREFLGLFFGSPEASGNSHCASAIALMLRSHCVRLRSRFAAIAFTLRLRCFRLRFPIAFIYCVCGPPS